MPIDHQQLTDLFARALELEPSGWESFARDALPDDADRRELLALLRFHHTQAGPELTADVLSHWLKLPPRTFAPGDRLDDYEVLGTLGSGGNSTVYLARQTGAIEREVALKVLRLPEPLRRAGRFAAERNAMAMLQHPGIAQVYHANTTADGIAYIAMERAPGVPIDAWARVHRPDVRQTVRLVLQVADALQTAHARGVIHRDLKPSNILVDGPARAPRVKLIDFGLVSAAPDSMLCAYLDATAQRLGGTPLFMAPEQADADAPADVAADVYGLCAVLYLLLCGRPPVALDDLHDADLARLFDAVRTRPRTPLLAADSTLPADLAAVVDKGLSPTRYASVASLVDDLERFVEDRAVRAYAGSRLYHAGRFLTRNRVPVAAGATLGLILVAGLIGTSTGFVRARQQNSLYQEQLRVNLAINQFLTDDLLGAAVPGRDGRDVRVVEVVDRATRRVDERFADQPQVQADIRLVLGETLLVLGDAAKARPLLEASHAYFEPSIEAGSPRAWRAAMSMATLHHAAGEIEPAADLCDRVLRLPATDRDKTVAHAAAHTIRAQLASDRQQFDDALRDIDQSIALLQSVTPDREQAALRLVEAYNLRALILDAAGQTDAARKAFEALPAQIEALLGPGHVYLAAARVNVAAMLMDEQRYAEALPMLEASVPVYDKEYGPTHEQTLILRGNLVSALSATGQHDRAIELAKALVPQLDASVPVPFNRTNARHRVATTLLRAKRFDAAIDAARNAFDYATQHLGDTHWLTAQCQATLGYAHADAGNTEEAIQTLTEARERFLKSVTKDNPRVLTIDERLAQLRTP